MSQKESEWERKLLDLVDNKEAGYMDFSELIQETLSNREKEIAEEVKDSFWECPTHGEPMSPTNCRDCNECLEVNIVLSSLLQILKHRQQENHT